MKNMLYQSHIFVTLKFGDMWQRTERHQRVLSYTQPWIVLELLGRTMVFFEIGA